MSVADIRRLDLSLLLTLSSLLRTRQVTATASELGVTQSSISHALGRLRAVFDDPLFVRRPTAMEPTARAIALQPVVESIIALSRQALAPTTFSLADVRGLVRIGALDNHCALLTAPLLEHLRAKAPQLKMSVRPLPRRQSVDALLAGRLDLGIGFFWNLPDTIERITLWQEDYAVVANPHDWPQKAISLDDYLSARHLLVSLDGDLTGVVDKTLARKGMTRNVVAAVPYFLAALAAAAATDVVVTLPLRLAQAHAAAFGLQWMKPPIPIRRFEVSAIRLTDAASEPLTAWLVDTITEIAKGFEAGESGGVRPPAAAPLATSAPGSRAGRRA